jgi:predicted metalloprotease with PDZ domain
MTTVRRLFLVLLASQPLTVLAAPPAPLVYTVSPVIEDGTVRALAVVLEFRTGAVSETTLALPKEWGGKDKLYEALSDFSVKGAGASISAGDKPEARTVHHRPNSRVRIRYLVHDAAGSKGENAYRPIVLPQRVELLGETFAVAPADTKMEQPVEVHFKGFPRRWAFASDLEHGHVDFNALLQSITVAGDFRVLTRQIHGVPLRVAIQGQWSFQDDWLVEQLAAISSAQYDFWKDRPEPYLVTFAQLEGGTSGAGTGLGDAFAMFATPDFSVHDLVRTLAHEMTHTWIPVRVGKMPEDQRSEALEYWFSEGFADYYAARALVQSRIWSAEDFANGVNLALKRYAGSSARLAPNQQIGDGFWKDSNLQQLPYDRGFLFAIKVDQELRLANHGAVSLDDVVLVMRRHFDQEKTPIRQSFIAAMAAHGVDVKPELSRFIDDGNDIALDGNTFAPCGSVVSGDLPTFHRGFDVDATMKNGMRITGVDPELPAWRAGLRDGMTLLRRDAGTIGDATQEIAYRVMDQGAERVIRYLPQGHGTVRFQSLQLRIDESVHPLVECRRRLGATS